MSFDIFSNSSTIDELHTQLKNNFFSEKIQELKSSPTSLEQIPILIKQLYEKEMSTTTSGIKRLKLAKQAAESAFYCYQMTIGKSSHAPTSETSFEIGMNYLNEFVQYDVLKIEIESEYESLRNKYNKGLEDYLRFGKSMDENCLQAREYCFILAKILDLQLPEASTTEMHFLPPLKIGFQVKLEYNGIATILNRQIEKKEINAYANDIEALSSNDNLFKVKDALQQSLLSYRRIIELDYPKFGDQNIKYLIHLLQFHATLLGIPLSEQQLHLEERIPTFGIDDALSNPVNYQASKQKRDTVERYFYKRLLTFDLCTNHMLLSTVHRNIKPGAWFLETTFNDKKETAVESILTQVNEIENMLTNAYMLITPSIECWEKCSRSTMNTILFHYHLLRRQANLRGCFIPIPRSLSNTSILLKLNSKR